jgi:hypothetical protein
MDTFLSPQSNPELASPAQLATKKADLAVNLRASPK